MVYDRTIEDVNEAKRIAEEVIKAFQTPTQTQLDILERGMLTVTAINRIESKQEEIRQRLNEAGYYDNLGSNQTDWVAYDSFMQEDLQRLADNCKSLRNSFFVYADTPEPPKPIYHFEEINKMEKILVDLESAIQDMVSRYRECGTFNSGE